MITQVQRRTFFVLTPTQAGTLRSFVSGLDALLCNKETLNSAIVRHVAAFYPELERIAAALELQD